MRKALLTFLLLAGLPAVLASPAFAEETAPIIGNLLVSDCEGNLQSGSATTSTGAPTIQLNFHDAGNGLAIGRVPVGQGGTVLSSVVGLYHLDGNGTDSSGHGNTGTASGGVSFNATVPEASFTQSVLLNAAGENVFIGVSPTMQSTTDQITIAAWIQPTVTTSRPVFTFDSATGQGVHLWVGSPAIGGAGEVFANFVDSTSASHSLTSPPGLVAAGAWSHVAATFNGSVGRIYHNGVQVASSPIGVIPPMRTGLIGRMGTSPSLGISFNGQIDDVLIASRAFASQAILNLYHSGNVTLSTVSPSGPFYVLNLASNTGGQYTPTNPAQGTTAVTTATLTQFHLGNGIGSFEYTIRDRSGATRLAAFSLTTNISVPQPPALLTATPLSNSQIRWDWNKPTRICLTNASTPGTYNVYDENDVLLQGNIVEPTRTHTQAGYGANTLHGGKISSEDDYGESAKSSVATAYTLANAPVINALSFISTGSLVVSYNTSGNPAHTRYQVVLYADNGFAVTLSTPVEITANHTASTVTLTGLSAATTYYIGIRAKNGAFGDSGLGTNFTAFTTTGIPTLPQAPGTLVGTGISPTQVLWNWSAITAAQSYDLEAATGTFLIQTGGLSHTVSALAVNTAYGARLRAITNSGPSAYGGAVFIFTRANPPTGTAITSVTTGSINISYAANGNPAATSYQTFIASDNAFGGTVNSQTTTNLISAFGGLLQGATYYLRVRALNGNTVPTTFDGTVSAVTNILGPTTSAPTPQSPYTLRANTVLSYPFDQSSGTTILDGSGNGNHGTMSCTFFGCSTPTFTTGGIGMGNAGQFTGIQNTLCRANHSATLASAGSLSVETWVNPSTTLQTPQAGIVAKGSGTAESFALDVFNSRWRFFIRGPGFVGQFPVLSTQTLRIGRYNHVVGVYDASTPSLSIYIDGVLSSSATAADLPGLPASRGVDSHELTIGNRQTASADYNLGFQGSIDDLQLLTRALTPAEVALSFAGGRPSTLTLPSPNNDTSLIIPPDAFGQGGAIILVSSFPTGSPLAIDPNILRDGLNNPPTGQTLIPGTLTEIIANQGGSPFTGSFASSITVILQYPDTDGNQLIDGVTPFIPVQQLRMYTLNPSVVQWEALPSAVDLNARTVTGLTGHFSIFALFGPSGIQPNVSSARAYPVPWRPGSGTRFDSVTFQGRTGMAFDNLSDSGSIRIFTLSGELVTTLNFTSFNAGTFIWDGTNQGGRGVASGVYFAAVKGDDGTNQIIKFAVEK